VTTPGANAAPFPGFDVLAQAQTWDEVTRRTVLARLEDPAGGGLFTPAQRATAEALFDQLLGQHHDPRVPVVAMVEQRLADGETDGWHFEDMPVDGPAFLDTMAGLDADASEQHGQPFAVLAPEQQATLVQAVRDISTGEGDTRWRGLPADHVWSLWTRYGCTAFYSHPWAWNEIGFGGPAYPRGYKNMGLDAREPWEVSGPVPPSAGRA